MSANGSFHIFVYGFGTANDAHFLSAAARAGATAVLDLDAFPQTEQDAATTAALILSQTHRSWGLRLGTLESIEPLPLHLPSRPTVLVLGCGTNPALLANIPLLRSRFPRHETQLFAEVISNAQIDAAIPCDIDGLVTKGNEAGGWVSEETTFVLLQKACSRTSLPVIAYGGVGMHSAAGCYAAGASGVILREQLALAREAGSSAAARAALERMDGGETICLTTETGIAFRGYFRPGTASAKFAGDLSCGKIFPHEWKLLVEAHTRWGDPENALWPLGQDGAQAVKFARSSATVGSMLGSFRTSLTGHVVIAKEQKPLASESRLARSHGTLYSLIQGPMTRVSDTAPFAAAVAENGALPFLALALMRAPDVERLLRQTSESMGGRPWGVGLLGFAPAELRAEQLQAVRSARPPFAIIAGGRPDQAAALELEGITTYLHVPSPGLLKQFLEQDARRFIFEGRECGGHVGPRSSLVLWDMMVDTIMNSLTPAQISECHLIFAGGIHDDRSAALVAALAAPLTSHAARVGVLVGTGYLFTREAVETGAILPGFQREAINCTATVLLETGPGHSTRCAATPFAKEFSDRRAALVESGASGDEVRVALEELNLGRLRIASKGLRRKLQSGLEPVPEPIQRLEGMYMIGQVAALRDGVCTMADLHREICVGGTSRIESLPLPDLGHSSARLSPPKPCDIAVVGMACIFPKAPNLHAYWRNILAKVDAITEIPANRWDWKAYYAANRDAPDKVYSKWGGFIDDVAFDPVRYGIPPASLSSIEPLQLLALEVARQALEDAGYAERPFPRERTAVILGAGGGLAELGSAYALRSSLPSFLQGLPAKAFDKLPQWTEDSFAGILLNVAAGRIANRFNLGGTNYTVDAACASSLAAVYLAANELETGTSDVVLAGGADTMQNPFAYLCFSKTQALSPRGRCRTFDDSADGIAISEGIAILVLKRLSDAERDADRVYAVIKGIAGSSDGQARGLTAPRPEGQARSLRRAYEQAGVSPRTVGLIEAHGTGTVVGDRAELDALKTVFSEAGAEKQQCAVGSVKSMIGHTKCAAGIAGLIKAVLALHYGVLPPTLHVETPNTKVGFKESPFYPNPDPRPWIRRSRSELRRAGVSAFGFGGTNFHAVLEEYPASVDSEPVPREQAIEVFAWTATSCDELLRMIATLRRQLRLAPPNSIQLCDLAFTTWRHYCQRAATPVRLAILASSVEALAHKLEVFERAPHSSEADSIYFCEHAAAKLGKLAVLFPSQGSQKTGMLSELAMRFPQVRRVFEAANQVLSAKNASALADYIFPVPAFSADEKRAQEDALKATQVAQPALGTAGVAYLHLLRRFGVHPDCTAGHSYGEYAALCAAGVFSEQTLYAVSAARGRAIAEVTRHCSGTMAAVSERASLVESEIHPLSDVWIANINGPRQTVISGTEQAIEGAIQLFASKQITARRIPVACAFHSPLVNRASEQLDRVLHGVDLAPPSMPVYSNETARPYPSEPDAIRVFLKRHLGQRVSFLDEICNMHTDGVRVFVEAGPGAVLTNLVKQILADEPHLAVSASTASGQDLYDLGQALCRLFAYGVAVDFAPLYEGRSLQLLDLATVAEQKPSPTTWLVNGRRALPISTPENVPQPMRVDELFKITAPAQSKVAKAAIHFDTTAVADPAPAFPDTNGIDIERVMLRYQEMMARVMDGQQQVMLAYLQGGGVALRQAKADTVEPSETVPQLQPAAPAIAAEPRAEQPETLPVALSADEAAIQNTVGAPACDTHAGESLTDMLLSVASERTGYPAAMLGLDKDISGELGIDSIKWVEILGAFTRTAVGVHHRALPGMEKLATMKTLRQVIETMESDGTVGASVSTATGKLPAPSPQPSQAAVGAARAHQTPAREEGLLLRSVPATVEVPPSRSLLRITGRILITDDELGVAKAVASRLQDMGASAILVRHRQQSEQFSGDCYGVNLVDPDATLAFVSDLVRSAEITGLLHLLPLGTPGGESFSSIAEFRGELDRNLISLFNLLKALAPSLKAQLEGGGIVLAATRMGGSFGIDQDPGVPIAGGVAGLTKTVAAEWPGIRARVIDFGLQEPEWIAGTLLLEMASEDPHIEVGYTDARRMAVDMVEQELAFQQRTMRMPSGSVVLITGGARGITYEIACEMAARFRPKLHIVGRTSLPSSDDWDRFPGLRSRHELRAALIAADSPEPHRSIVALEARITELLRVREIRANLDHLRAAGADVVYHDTDVRDAEAFSSLLERIYAEHGRIDCVVHGAGVIEDKLIEDKDLESFRRVLETKVIGAHVLSTHLRPDSLRQLIFFSSIAGRFGNRGQCDYVAANEVLNKIAASLNRRWPAKVLALNWGPWSGAGMVSEAVAQQFAKRGIGLIERDAGCRAFLNEIAAEKGKADAEIVLRMPAMSQMQSQPQTMSTADTPLLGDLELRTRTNGHVECSYLLSVRKFRFLNDHRLDGIPVLPATAAAAMMAELAQKTYPSWHVTAVRSLRVLKGVTLESGERALRLIATSHEQTSGDAPTTDVDIEIREPGADRALYSASIELRRKSPEPPVVSPDSRPSNGMPADEIYSKYLFHGDLMRCISRIESITPTGISAVLGPSTPSECISGGQGHWLLDPILLDGAPQLVIVWARMYLDTTVLPVSFRQLRLHARANGDLVRCDVAIEAPSQSSSLRANVNFVDLSGRVIAVCEGLEGAASRSLNRLAGAQSA